LIVFKVQGFDSGAQHLALQRQESRGNRGLHHFALGRRAAKRAK
jgi:hypothetical protein